MPGPVRALPSVARAAVEIEYELDTAGPARLRLFDPAGREVRELLNSDLPPGRYAVRWDGLDRSGRELPAGSYYYRLEAGGRQETGRLTLVR